MNLKRIVLYSAACCCSLLALPRSDRNMFREPLELGGRLVAAETLNRGQVCHRRHCAGCHGRRGDRKGPAPAIRPDIHRASEVSTQLGRLTAPDSLADSLRVRRRRLYRTIAAGVGGTPMSTWSNRLQARVLWAVVHYMEQLLRYRGTPRAAELRATVARGETANKHEDEPR